MMTVAEAKKRKQEAEEWLLGAIRKFEADSGCVVYGIDLHRVEVTGIRSVSVETRLASVRLEVEIE